ncbi:EAL domain-containing protein [Pseudomonadota bacterium]
MSNKRQILIVDDEPDIGAFICDVAINMGFEAIATHQPSAFEQLYSDDFDIIILDLMMPERDGIELLRFMASQQASAQIILISGYDPGVLHSAQKLASEQGLNIIQALTKPILYEDLEALLSSLQFSLDDDNKQASAHSHKPTTQELQRALAKGELQAYFQPKLAINSGKLVGAEALIRWNHPEHGLLAPSVIIPLAKQAGLMEALTSEVLQQAFQQANEWLKHGLHLKVAINMDACSFKDLALPEWVDAEIKKYHLHPGQIIFEVTETTLMQELIKSLDILTRLRMKDVALSIDDFGTGYSSLTQLYQMPFSEMKIDQSFVMHASTDAEALAIIKMSTLLGHELGMTVVAEGIETQKTWDMLSDIGCDIAQGYFIAKPMSGKDFSAWALEHNHTSA